MLGFGELSVDFASGRDLLSAHLQIAAINVVLSGDNAVVIALACRRVPPCQQKQAFLIGSIGVIVLMTVLTAFAAYLMSLRYVELIGAALLSWIGIKLLLPEGESDDLKQSEHLGEAVKT